MTIIDYYKQQSKLLLKDYKLFKENNCNQNESAYLDPQEHFDINNVLSKVNKLKVNPKQEVLEKKVIQLP